MMTLISNYGSMFAFIIQMLFDIIVAVSALWAAINFSRYVKFMMSEPVVTTPSEKVSVDEFVE